MVAESVAFLVDRGREVVYDAEHYFDGYKADRGYALDTLRAARQAGARSLVLCDTNGGTLTDEMVAILTDTQSTLEADPAARRRHLGHPHPQRRRDGGGQLHRRGAGRCPPRPGTINGYGERCGNANMVSILANLALKTDVTLVPVGGGDISALTSLSRSVAEIANQVPNDYQPFVGRSAFAHKGGVHGAAVAKVERSYQHVDPKVVGNEGRLVVSELGGKANTRIRAEQLGMSLEGVVDAQVLSRLIKQMESDGARFRGRRGILRAAHPASRRGVRAALPDRRLHRAGGAARGPGAAGRGDREGGRGRRGAAHGGRRQRPRERP